MSLNAWYTCTQYRLSLFVPCSYSCFNRNMSTHKDNCLSIHRLFKTWRQEKQHVLQCLCRETQELVLPNVFVRVPQLSFCWLAERLISCSTWGFQKPIYIQPCVMKACSHSVTNAFVMDDYYSQFSIIHWEEALYHCCILSDICAYSWPVWYYHHWDVWKGLFMYQHNKWEITWSIMS